MTGPPAEHRTSRLDWSRVEAWAEQFARGDLSQMNAVFAANGAVAPRVLWRPHSRQLPSLQLRFILDYWSDLKGEADLPRSSGVDLRQLAPILGYETLIDVVDGGRDFRYRRCGGVLIGVSGNDMTGKLLSEHPTSAYVVESSLALYRAACRRREPVYTERTPAAAAFTKSWQRLLLPLTGDANRIESFLVGSVPIGAEGLPVYCRSSGSGGRSPRAAPPAATCFSDWRDPRRRPGSRDPRGTRWGRRRGECRCFRSASSGRPARCDGNARCA